MRWLHIKQSKSATAATAHSTVSPRVESTVGKNYQPLYIPHPAAVDPYARALPLQDWRVPRLSLRVEDLSNPGVELFFQNIKPLDALRDAVLSVLQCLYTIQTQPKNVHSITLILRDFAGAAHTNGSAANAADKEIHLSTRHIQASAARARQEILGVLTHEMAHCYQYNARGTCPEGLIEGIADFVRLRASLAPPHWKRGPPLDNEKWDAGYDRTAFFLDWVEQSCGEGVIRELNEAMWVSRYDKVRVWRSVTGHTVEELWATYKKA